MRTGLGWHRKNIAYHDNTVIRLEKFIPLDILFKKIYGYLR